MSLVVAGIASAQKVDLCVPFAELGIVRTGSHNFPASAPSSTYKALRFYIKKIPVPKHDVVTNFVQVIFIPCLTTVFLQRACSSFIPPPPFWQRGLLQEETPTCFLPQPSWRWAYTQPRAPAQGFNPFPRLRRRRPTHAPSANMRRRRRAFMTSVPRLPPVSNAPVGGKQRKEGDGDTLGFLQSIKKHFAALKQVFSLLNGRKAYLS